MNIREASYQNPGKEYREGEHLVYACQYHVVFCPKYRRRILKPPYDERAKELFLAVAKEHDFRILAMEVMPDHVHMIIDCNPRFGICRCVTALKGRTSRIMREEFPEIRRKLPSLWTRETFISSVGAVSLDAVKQYIENQKGV